MGSENAAVKLIPNLLAGSLRTWALALLVLAGGIAVAHAGELDAPMQPIKKKSAAAVQACANCGEDEAALLGATDARRKDRGGPEFPAERIDGQPGGGDGGPSGSLIEGMELDRIGVSGVGGLPATPTLPPQ